MFGQMTRRGGENLAITRRRQIEDKRASLKASVHHTHNVGRMAQWEIKTDARIQQNTVMNMARTLEKRGKASLEQRRQRLAQLLAADDEVYRGELANLQETSAQKARRMVSVARALKLEREEKRKALAQEMYNRQWREGCDDLRLIDSDKFKNHCLEQVQKQLTEREMAKQKEKEEDQHWGRVMEEHRLKDLKKAEQEMRRRQAFNYETKVGLMEQMEDTRGRKELEAQKLEQERRDFQDAMEEGAEDEKKEQLRLFNAKRTQMAKIKEFNDMTTQAKADVAMMQREQELRDLQMKLDAHRHETEMKAADKAMMRADMLNYQAYLKQRKEEERQMERELEVLCQEEMDRANAKRDMTWMQERLARENLTADVFQIRMEQVKERDRERLRREEEVALERAAIEREQVKTRRLEEEEEAEAKHKERLRALDLDRQMAAHRNQRAIQKTAAMKEFEAAQQAEKQYRAFLQREKQTLYDGEYKKKSFGIKTIVWD